MSDHLEVEVSQSSPITLMGILDCLEKENGRFTNLTFNDAIIASMKVI